MPAEGEISQKGFYSHWEDSVFDEKSLGLRVNFETSGSGAEANISCVKFAFLYETDDGPETMDEYYMTWDENGTYTDTQFKEGSIHGNFNFDKKKVLPEYRDEDGWILEGNIVFSRDEFDYLKPDEEKSRYKATITFKMNNSKERTFKELYTPPTDPEGLMEDFDEDVFPNEVHRLTTLAVSVGAALGVLSLVFLLYSLQFQVATDDKEKIEEYKKHILRWGIGLFIIASSTVIMGALINAM